ncbi:hypothetical protein D3C77_383400 [compost metagenome]
MECRDRIQQRSVVLLRVCTGQIGPQAVLVHWDAAQLHARGLKHGNGVQVGGTLYQYGRPRLEQPDRDELQRLQRPGDDKHGSGRGRDAELLEPGCKQLAKPQVSHRLTISQRGSPIRHAAQYIAHLQVRKQLGRQLSRAEPDHTGMELGTVDLLDGGQVGPMDAGFDIVVPICRRRSSERAPRMVDYPSTAAFAALQHPSGRELVQGGHNRAAVHLEGLGQFALRRDAGAYRPLAADDFVPDILCDLHMQRGSRLPAGLPVGLLHNHPPTSRCAGAQWHHAKFHLILLYNLVGLLSIQMAGAKPVSYCLQ